MLTISRGTQASGSAAAAQNALKAFSGLTLLRTSTDLLKNSAAALSATSAVRRVVVTVRVIRFLAMIFVSFKIYFDAAGAAPAKSAAPFLDYMNIIPQIDELNSQKV